MQFLSLAQKEGGSVTKPACDRSTWNRTIQWQTTQTDAVSPSKWEEPP